MVWDGTFGRRRALVEDARHNGQFLRVTWHPDTKQFVVSNWEGGVCVGATRVPVAEAADLVGLLASGLAEAASQPAEAADAEPRTLAEHFKEWWRQRHHHAPVLPLSRSEVGPGRQRRGA